MYREKTITQLFIKAVATCACTVACICVSSIAHAQEAETAPTQSMQMLDTEDAEYAADMAALTALTGRNLPRTKQNLLERLRRIDREWPKLLRDYVNPLVRSMVSNGYRDGLSLRTTLFKDNNRGLALNAFVARDIRGDREARISFSLQF